MPPVVTTRNIPESISSDESDSGFCLGMRGSCEEFIVLVGAHRGHGISLGVRMRNATAYLLAREAW